MESDYKPLPLPIAREAVSAALAHVRQCERAYGQACAERAGHGAGGQARIDLDAKVRRLYRCAEQALGALQGGTASPTEPEAPNLLWDWELAQGGVHATGGLPHTNLRGVRSAGARALPYRSANGGKATRGAPRQSNTPKGMQWPA